MLKSINCSFYLLYLLIILKFFNYFIEINNGNIISNVNIIVIISVLIFHILILMLLRFKIFHIILSLISFLPFVIVKCNDIEILNKLILLIIITFFYFMLNLNIYLKVKINNNNT